jgi:molybdopterin converting factor small subunit
MESIVRMSGKMNRKRGDLFLQAELRLKGYMATVAPAARFVTELPEGSTVKDLLEAFVACHKRETREEILAPRGKSLAENVFLFMDDGNSKRQVSLETVLCEGALVTVTSPLAGG